MPIHKAAMNWQYEQHTAAGAAADASDGGCEGAQLPEPGVLGSEPEDTEESINGDLRVAVLDEEVNQQLQLEKMEEPDDALLPMLSSTSEGPRDSESNGNSVESISGTGASA